MIESNSASAILQSTHGRYRDLLSAVVTRLARKRLPRAPM